MRFFFTSAFIATAALHFDATKCANALSSEAENTYLAYMAKGVYYTYPMFNLTLIQSEFETEEMSGVPKVEKTLDRDLWDHLQELHDHGRLALTITTSDGQVYGPVVFQDANIREEFRHEKRIGCVRLVLRCEWLPAFVHEETRQLYYATKEGEVVKPGGKEEEEVTQDDPGPDDYSFRRQEL